jgi:uncharacterized protein (DUF1015 family)
MANSCAPARLTAFPAAGPSAVLVADVLKPPEESDPMSVIRPFPAIRYDTRRCPDLSSRLAPPYDIIDDHAKAALLARDSDNFVKIDLPYMPPKAAGPDGLYQESRQTIDRWLRDGTLVRDRQPALYVYHQLYRHADAAYVRKMFAARLRLEPFFGLYEDAENVIARRLEQGLPATPLASGTLDGVENRLWAVSDAATIGDVTRLMASKPTYIADGHHRCGTGMLYRDWLIAQQGPLPPEHPANFVLCVFCAMEDPGLLILPTHRLVPGVNVGPDTFAGDARVEIQPLEVADASAAIAALRRFGPQAVAVFSAAAQRYYVLRPASEDILDSLEPERTPAWRRLGVAFLHAYVLDRVIAPRLCGGQPAEVRYIKADDEAVRAARAAQGSVFLMQPTTMEELRAVCSAGDLMPQKSTYFYPKLASGLVINPLTE